MSPLQALFVCVSSFLTPICQRLASVELRRYVVFSISGLPMRPRPWPCPQSHHGQQPGKAVLSFVLFSHPSACLCSPLMRTPMVTASCSHLMCYVISVTKMIDIFIILSVWSYMILMFYGCMLLILFSRLHSNFLQVFYSTLIFSTCVRVRTVF